MNTQNGLGKEDEEVMKEAIIVVAASIWGRGSKVLISLFRLGSNWGSSVRRCILTLGPVSLG